MPSDIIRALSEISYFRALPEDELRSVAKACRTVKANGGEALFYEGEPAKGLFVVLSGGAKAVRHSPEGRQLIVREFRPGDTLNEVGALDGSENPATAIATREDTSLLLVPTHMMKSLAGRYPDFSAHVMRVMAAKLRFAMKKASDLALLDVKARLAIFLLESVSEDGAVRGMSQEELAAQLGTVRQVLGRALSDLQKAGAIEVHRGLIKVLDRSILEACV